jgi:hypothetical protein
MGARYVLLQGEENIDLEELFKEANEWFEQ